MTRPLFVSFASGEGGPIVYRQFQEKKTEKAGNLPSSGGDGGGREKREAPVHNPMSKGKGCFKQLLQEKRGGEGKDSAARRGGGGAASGFIFH